MATGPEHYQEAQRLLAVNAGKRDDPSEPTVIAAAQVHATLALTAAVALAAPSDEMPQADIDAWVAVASGHKREAATTAGGGGPRGASFSNGPLEPRSLRDLPRTETIFNLMEPRPYQ